MTDPLTALRKTVTHFHDYWHSDLAVAECPEDICIASLEGLAALPAPTATPSAPGGMHVRLADVLAALEATDD